MTTLFILNDPPYGTERAYNALRLAGTLARSDETEVRVFLLADAASCARSGQAVPNGYYNLERMLKGILARGGEVGVCGTCMDARGIGDDEMVEGARRSSMQELAEWTTRADRLLVF